MCLHMSIKSRPVVAFVTTRAADETLGRGFSVAFHGVAFRYVTLRIVRVVDVETQERLAVKYLRAKRTTVCAVNVLAPI